MMKYDAKWKIKAFRKEKTIKRLEKAENSKRYHERKGQIGIREWS